MAERTDSENFAHDGNLAGVSRRWLMLGAACLGITSMVACLPGSMARAADVPAKPAETRTLLRLKIVTMGAPDPVKIGAIYAKWFNYRVRETGKVTAEMAASWGAPKSAGRPYVMMSSDGHPDVFIRVVGIDPVPGYKAKTSAGWNSFELMVDDIDGLYKELSVPGSPFKVTKTPQAPVKEFPTVYSMDVMGPAGELLFLTCEKGDRDKSWMPKPDSKVGRPHVAWVAGPDIIKVRDWHVATFGLASNMVREDPVPGSTTGATMPNTVLMLKERGNFLQFLGDPAQSKPRPHGNGQLPPGNSMASFSVASLDALKLAYITPPKVMYGGLRAATVLDPNGNRVELVEEPGR
jgi:hypothetical protein